MKLTEEFFMPEWPTVDGLKTRMNESVEADIEANEKISEKSYEKSDSAEAKAAFDQKLKDMAAAKSAGGKTATQPAVKHKAEITEGADEDAAEEDVEDAAAEEEEDAGCEDLMLQILQVIAGEGAACEKIDQLKNLVCGETDEKPEEALVEDLTEAAKEKKSADEVIRATFDEKTLKECFGMRDTELDELFDVDMGGVLSGNDFSIKDSTIDVLGHNGLQEGVDAESVIRATFGDLADKLL